MKDKELNSVGYHLRAAVIERKTKGQKQFSICPFCGELSKEVALCRRLGLKPEFGVCDLHRHRIVDAIAYNLQLPAEVLFSGELVQALSKKA